MNNLFSHSIKDLRRLLDSKKLSALEITQAYLNQAEKLNSQTNAYITLAPETALSQARAADQLIQQGRQKPLTGIPFGLKDAYVTQGLTTTSASTVLEGYQPQYNATVYQSLLDQHAVTLGKHNQDAWGHGSSSENTDYQPVHNPWDLSRTAGGSSGGSAAALASNACLFAIGEDTGGSIRNPASFTNVSGLKVTYGRVSRYGAIAYGSSLDTVGPMARSVEDLAEILAVIAGYDPRDASSSQEPVPDYPNLLRQPLKGKKLGILKQYFSDGLQPEVKTILAQAIREFEALGLDIQEVDIPTAKYGVAIYYILALSETSSNLARYDGVRFGRQRDRFSSETKRRILTGTYALSAGYYDAYYKQALKARTRLIREFTQAFTQVDAIIAPVMPFPAFPLGDPAMSQDVTAMYLADLYTCGTNPVGIPSLAIPAGFTGTRLPVGMQLMGPMFSEAWLLSLGYHYQQATAWHRENPPISSSSI